MEKEVIFMEPLFDRIEEYGKTSYELIKLKALDKTVDVTSTVVSRNIAIRIFSLFILITSVGIALWLGDLFGKLYYGFFCVAGFYGIAFLIIYYVMHGRIKKYVSDSIISQVFN